MLLDEEPRDAFRKNQRMPYNGCAISFVDPPVAPRQPTTTSPIPAGPADDDHCVVCGNCDHRLGRTFSGRPDLTGKADVEPGRAAIP